MRTLILVLALMLQSGSCRWAMASSTDCIQGVTDSPAARSGLPIPGIGQCDWGGPLSDFLTGWDMRGGLLDTNGTWTGIQTFNAGDFLDKGTEVVNVKAFGAVGDGSTDDTVAIQAALDFAVGLGYPKVFLPDGVYKISAGLNLNNVILFGAGPGATGTTRGGSILDAGLTGGMLTGTVVTVTDTVHNGAMRPSALRDLAIVCNAVGQTKGLHMTHPVEGVRLDTTAQIENVRIQYCEYGLRTNAATGHQLLKTNQIINNYCGMTVNLVGSGSTDGGNFTAYDTEIAGSSFAAVCLPAGSGAGGMGDAHFVRTGFGFSPYAFWQQGPATSQMLGATIFDDCEFEAVGNGAFAAKNKTGIGGSLNEIRWNSVGYADSSLDSTLNLPSTDCLLDNNPYECCTGFHTGCTHDYAVDVGVCNVLKIKSGIHPFATPSGGLGAIHCTACQSKIQVSVEAGSSPVVVCDSNPSFIQIEDGQGRTNWSGNTPTDTPPVCVSGIKGTHYSDLSLSATCVCNGTAWCRDAAPAVCGSSSSCDATSGATGVIDGLTEGRRYFSGAPAGTTTAGTATTALFVWGASPGLFVLQTGGAQAGVLDDATGFYADNNSTSAGASAGLITNSASTATDKVFSRRHGTIVSVTLKTGTDITQQRVWVGLSATVPGSLAVDTPTLSSAMFRYSTNASDTIWQAQTYDGTTATTTSTGVTVVANTRYVMKVDLSTSGHALFSINGTQVADITTNLPLTATMMNLNAIILSTGAVTRTLRTGAFLASSL